MTLNMSSGGILFASQDPVDPLQRLEVTVNWPVQLEGRCPLKLVTIGRVVWIEGPRVAVKIEKYEFRTRGSSDN